MPEDLIPLSDDDHALLREYLLGLVLYAGSVYAQEFATLTGLAATLRKWLPAGHDCTRLAAELEQHARRARGDLKRDLAMLRGLNPAMPLSTRKH
ncbi:MULTISPECIES: hypothetical protein [unclassified Burkholderia]|uniref:hypothetical protein n=1 Tax=unclassified Burkholderia TaxID=2613784 RepID=UPI0007564A11|nr:MULTISPECIES: hypothetical protein [unclassified Burkholderia]KVN06298.1 hypothetical protein WT08_20335 [Burkholderia sp. MSMB1552]KWZ46870.1 hypothetical protein WS92_30345 [Burkholderia sp. MSMB1588]